MRGIIFDKLYERMAKDRSVFFLTGDMGINLVERLEQAYPVRFCNVGIAEQNLVGVAAGLCNAGFRPILYTISNFLVHRCLEQIRNDLVMHDYPAVLLGTSTGFDNAPLGPTHYMIDDWGTIASIPDIDIYCPSGVDYAACVLERALSKPRVSYIRVPKGRFTTPGGDADAVYVKGNKKGILLVSYGTLVQECLAVQKTRDDVSVLILNCMRPLDEAVVVAALRDHVHVLSVEDHRVESGLYGLLCRVCVENGVWVKLHGLGVRPGYPLDVGASAEYHHHVCGVDSAGIGSTIEKLVSNQGEKTRAA